MQLQEAIKNFKFHCEFEKNLSSKTLSAYSIDLEQFISYTNFRTLNIEEFDKYKLKEYIQHLHHLEFKVKTIKRKIAVIKAFFTYLEFEEYIIISPFRKMRISIKEPNLLPKIIELKEVRKFLKYLYNQKDLFPNKTIYGYSALVRDIAVLEILFSTGVRVSELCNIRQENINIQSGNIKIYGKGSKERVIHICDQETKAILKEYVNIFNDRLLNSDYFLINRLGSKLSEQSVRLMIKKYQKKLNIEKNITPHMFRHSFATSLLEEGVDIRYIQHMLGHSSISTTQIYTRVNTKQQRKILSAKHPRRHFSFVNE